MPTFGVNQRSHKGDFHLEFDPNKKARFGPKQRQLPEFEVFRRYGNMPDNDVAVNKLINVVGRNLLSLEQKKMKLDARYTNEPNNELYGTTELYTNFEIMGNQLTVGLLCALAPLEQKRCNQTMDIDSVIGNVGDAYNNYVAFLEAMGKKIYLKYRKQEYVSLKIKL
jgi:hypothetical protein